jgi:hypothetical protein
MSAPSSNASASFISVCVGACALLLTACGGRTVSFDFTMGLSPATQQNVTGDARLAVSGAVGGTSWSSFTSKVHHDCGKDPNLIEVTAAGLSLDGGDFDDLGKLFRGSIVIVLADRPPIDSSAVRIVIANKALVSGVGPVAFDVVPKGQAPLTPLQKQVLDGDIFLGVEGPTLLGSTPFSVRLTLTLSLLAHC